MPEVESVSDSEIVYIVPALEGDTSPALAS